MISDILKKGVSYQKDTWAAFSKEMTIEEVLNEISREKYKSQVDRLRNLLLSNDLESFKAEKLKLPAVTFCGTFNVLRKKDSLKTYNQLIVIDIDKLIPEEFERVKNILIKEEIVLSFWTSPSGNGLKGLVPLKYKCEIKDIDHYHKSAFGKLSDYFLNRHKIQLDVSGSDTTRLCFVSCDHLLIVKEQFKDFVIEESDINKIYEYAERQAKKVKLIDTNRKDALYNPKGKNKNYDRRSIKDIIDYLTRKKISIASEYENRYRIAYAIANTFTYDIGIKYFLALCKIEVSKYNEGKATKLLQYCYENNTGWTTLNFIKNLAQTNGYIKNTEERSFVLGAKK